MQNSDIIYSQLYMSNSIDTCVTNTASLFDIIMELEQKIEDIRIKLSEQPRFYPEQVFTYLRDLKQVQQPDSSTNTFRDFFNFDLRPSVQQQSNFINSSKDGLISFEHISKFIFQRARLSYDLTDVQMIEQIFHTHQSKPQMTQTEEEQQRYPLPADVQFQLEQQRKIMQQDRTLVKQFKFALSEEELNSGKGFNYMTFLKLVLCQSIPGGRNKVLKRKLIYEPDTNPSVPDSVLDLLAQLITLEITLLKKSEQLRIQIVQDGEFNIFTLFKLFDHKREEQIDYESLEHVLVRTQHSINPKRFQCLLRRALMLAGKNPEKHRSYLTFEDFKNLIQVRFPYYKKPIQQTSSQASIKSDQYQVQRIYASHVDDGYSRILDINVSTSTNQQSQQINKKLRKVDIDNPNVNKIKPSTSNYQSNMHVEVHAQGPVQANIPIYHSNNLAVTNLVRGQVQPQMQKAPAIDEYVMYGTKQEWEQQNKIRQLGVNDRSHTPQPLNQESQLVKPSTNFDSTPIRSNYQSVNQGDKSSVNLVDQISGEARLYQQQMKGQQNNMQLTEVIKAQQTNTKHQNINNIYQLSQRNIHEGTVYLGAPWNNIDRDTQRKVDNLNQEMDQIRSFVGIPQQPYLNKSRLDATKPPNQNYQSPQSSQIQHAISQPQIPLQNQRDINLSAADRSQQRPMSAVSRKANIFGQVEQSRLQNNVDKNDLIDRRFDIRQQPRARLF